MRGVDISCDIDLSGVLKMLQLYQHCESKMRSRLLEPAHMHCWQVKCTMSLLVHTGFSMGIESTEVKLV